MIRLVVPELGDEETRAVREVMDSGYLVQGKKVAEFEALVAGYVGSKYGVAVNSGTSALHLSLLALGIGQGDEVITSDFTFPATANAIELTGAKAVLVDIDLNTYNIDVGQIERKLSDRTKAIVPVHIFGLMADMEPILDLAHRYDLRVIEDAACALGATCVIKGETRYAGSLGDLGCFSFHPRKNITTGEGGMVVTDNSELAQEIRELRNHGMVSRHGKADFASAGYNNRMTEMQAAIGLVQMGKLNAIIHKKAELARVYDSELRHIQSLSIPQGPARFKHVYQTYAVLLPSDLDRDRLISELREEGIEANIGTYALHALEFYRSTYGLQDAQFANARTAFDKCLALPLYPSLGCEQIHDIVRILRKVSQRTSRTASFGR